MATDNVSYRDPDTQTPTDGDHFFGLEFDDSDNLSFYDTPRLAVPGPV